MANYSPGPSYGSASPVGSAYAERWRACFSEYMALKPLGEKVETVIVMKTKIPLLAFTAGSFLSVACFGNEIPDCTPFMFRYNAGVGSLKSDISRLVDPQSNASKSLSLSQMRDALDGYSKKVQGFCQSPTQATAGSVASDLGALGQELHSQDNAMSSIQAYTPKMLEAYKVLGYASIDKCSKEVDAFKANYGALHAANKARVSGFSDQFKKCQSASSAGK